MTITTTSPIKPFRPARMDIHVFRADVSKPVVTSFGTMTSRATVLLRVEDTDGHFGWGEIWGNFPSITSEYRAQLAGWALPSLTIGKQIDDPAAFIAGVQSTLKVMEVQSDEPGPNAGIAAGLDQAIWDLAARRAGVSLRHLLRDGAPDRVPAYASGLNPTGAIEKVAECRARGFRGFKQKIGFGDDIDHGNLAGIRRDMQGGEALYADANMRWTVAEAVDKIKGLAVFDLAWLEEPIRADQPPEAWRAVKAAMPMPLAAGENLRGAAAFTEALEWVDFMQPDVGKLGGVTGCLAIAREALEHGRTYCPHWLSGGVGLLHSANLLAAAGGAGVLEMDSNMNPLRDAVLAGSIRLAEGDALLPGGSGIGIDIDTDAMDQWKVSHQTFR